MAYPPSQLSPKIQQQIASSPEMEFHLAMESMKEASYAQHLDNTKDGGFEAEVISGTRTGEATGAGTDPIDSKIITINGKNYLEILVKSSSGKGLTYPHPNSEDLTDKQRTEALEACEWARSAVPIEGVPTPPNAGDIVTCFYEKGAQRNSDFNGLRYQTSGVSAQMLQQLMMQQGGGSLMGNFVGPLSPMALSALGAENGKLDQATANATVNLFKNTFLTLGYKWDERLNMVGVRNRGKGNPEVPGPSEYADFMYLFINKAFPDPVSPRTLTTDSWDVFKWEITTKPGVNFLGSSWIAGGKNKGRVAIFQEGQWQGSHKIRCHRCASKYGNDSSGNPNGYTALGQRRSVGYFQDSDANGTHTYMNPTKYTIGLNIHKTSPSGDPTRGNGKKATKNRGASLGCQVFTTHDDYMDFMALVMTYAVDPAWGGKPIRKPGSYPEDAITYTLLRSDEIR